ADHFVRGIVQDDLAAQRVARTAETPMPEPIADDRHPHALIVFLLCENASEQRLCAKDGPEIAGNSAARQFFGVAVTRECDLPWSVAAISVKTVLLRLHSLHSAGVEKNFGEPVR